ncbi:NUDIX domain-containing protein [Streptomyces sulphureus]|uniref:NUDIX domain-containing protein n=1 Tax=Streptomyces sulphureus TaxID=47758 RepID=UPI000367B6AE|nr:NUDIX hydrolase [Streptomyces sulphureus]
MTDASPAEPLAAGPLGIQLLSFAYDDVEDRRFDDAPLAYVVTALFHRGRFLLVHVGSRGCWELPGGGIERGERARDAAVRELWEESGQSVDAGGTRFVGYARTVLGASGNVRYGALYTAETDAPRPFVPNSETSAMHWYAEDEPPSGGVLQTCDTYLGALCRGRPTA